MALSLLDRVRNKAVEALSGVGSFLNQNVAQPVTQAYNTYEPSVARFAQDQFNKPLFPQAGVVAPQTSIPNLYNHAADFLIRGPLRSGYEIGKTGADIALGHQTPEYTPNGFASLILGADPLRDLRDPNRQGYKTARDLGVPGIGPLLVGLGTAANISPVSPTKIAEEGIAKSGITEGQNVLPKILTNYFKRKGSNAADFIADEAGNIAKVTEGGKKTKELFSKVEKTVLPSSGKIAGLLPSGEKLQLPAPKPNEIQILKQQAEAAATPGNIFKPKGNAQKIFENTFRSSKAVIQKAGPAGKEIVRRLDNAEAEAADAAGQAKVALRTALSRLNKDEITTFADVAEGRAPAISDAQQEAVNAWKSIAADVVQKGQGVGLDLGVRENYFPHFTLELSDAQRQKIAQEMVDSGQAETIADALQTIEKDSYPLSRQAPRRYGNLELARQTDLPYNKSPNVLFDYIDNAYGRIADAKHFGTADQELYKLARAAGTQGGDSDQILKYVDQILGKNQTQSKLANMATSLQTIAKLNPATSVVNLTQNLSTWLRTDTGTMAKTIGQVIANPQQALQNAIRAGEVGLDQAKELEDYTGGSNGAGKWIRLIGMAGTEKVNRMIAVNAGINYAEKLGRQAANGSEAAIRELQRFGLGLNDVKDGVLSDEGVRKIGRLVSRESQFSTKAGELPYYWRTNLGKVMTQFKSFAFKQTKFNIEQGKRVVSEAGQGNFKPLVNTLVVLGIAAPVAGEIVNDFKSLIKNKKRQDADTLTERYVSNILGAYSFGLLDADTLKGLVGGYGESGIVSTIAGPTAGDIIQGATTVADAAKGLGNYDSSKGFLDNVDPTGTNTRNLVKKIPGVGQTVANTFIPNAYTENIYGGVNNGLTEKDKETYNQLKEIDPAKAEEFRQANLTRNKPQESQNVFQSLFGGGKDKAPDATAWNTVPATKKEVTKYNSMVDKALEEGADVPDNALKQRFFKGLDYSKKDLTTRKKMLSAMESVQNNEFLTDEQKAKVLGASGISAADWTYYQTASMNAPEKLDALVSFAQGDHPDRQELLTALIGNKKQVGGKAIMNNEMVDGLYDRGLISKDEKSLMDAIKYDPIYEKFYVDRDYQAKYGSGGTADQAASKKLKSKLKAYVSSLNTIYKNPIKTSKKQRQPSLPKAPSVPKLNTTVSQPTRRSAEWFKPY